MRLSPTLQYMLMPSLIQQTTRKIKWGWYHHRQTEPRVQHMHDARRQHLLPEKTFPFSLRVSKLVWLTGWRLQLWAGHWPPVSHSIFLLFCFRPVTSFQIPFTARNDLRASYLWAVNGTRSFKEDFNCAFTQSVCLLLFGAFSCDHLPTCKSTTKTLLMVYRLYRYKYTW